MHKILKATAALFAFAVVMMYAPTAHAQGASPQTNTIAHCTTLPSSVAGNFQARIAAQARLWIGCSDSSFHVECAEACVATVNNIVHKALLKWLGDDRTVSNTDVLKAGGGIRQLSTQNFAVPGDFMIVDSRDGRNAHIGICLDRGCSDVISNSSTYCTFSFESAHNRHFSYPGSPYVNGIATFWRYQAVAQVRPAGAIAVPVLRPQSTHTHRALAAAFVESLCVNPKTDMHLDKWAYRDGYLLCATSDRYTGGQQLYAETSPEHFELVRGGGGPFRADDLRTPGHANPSAFQNIAPMSPSTSIFLTQSLAKPAERKP